MLDVSQFIAELERTVHEMQPGIHGFDAQTEQVNPSLTLVRVQFCDTSGRLRSDIWQMQYLAGVVGNDDAVELAQFAAERMLSDAQVVVLNCDWGHEWPLWAPGSDFYAAKPPDLGISVELEADLRGFYDFWEEHYVFEAGWDALGNRDCAQAEAVRLAAWLAAETVGHFEIENGFRFSFS